MMSVYEILKCELGKESYETKEEVSFTLSQFKLVRVVINININILKDLWKTINNLACFR